jgi:mycofactocin precursor
MTELTIEQTGVGPPAVEDPPPDNKRPREEADTKLIEKESLVEDVSIDGMCGVY